MKSQKTLPHARLMSIISLLIIASIISYYVYLLHTGAAQTMLKSIKDLGIFGILIGIIVQTLANIVPVPGEFITVILMEIYGPVWGGFYSWIGGIAGAVGALYLTRWVAKPFLSKKGLPFMKKIEEFTNKYGVLGLLFIRFVPFVPYHLLNYAMSFLRVNILSFIWTTGLGILPYSIAMSGIYAGVRQGSLLWGVIGAVVCIVLFGLSWLLKRRNNMLMAAKIGE